MCVCVCVCVCACVRALVGAGVGGGGEGAQGIPPGFLCEQFKLWIEMKHFFKLVITELSCGD